MNKVMKIWLIIAASLLFTGLIIFGSVMTVLGWDFKKLSTVKYETNEHGITQSFKNISIVSNTADIIFTPSEGTDVTVICHEQANLRHAVTVQDDTLTIKLTDTRRWYEYIGISFQSTTVTVYLPRAEYGALQINSHTGDVTIPQDFSFDSMDISQSTGNVTSRASAHNDVKIKTSTGNISVENVSVGALDLTVTTGNIRASRVSCEGDVGIHVSTGDTRLTDIACDNFSSNGSTGDIDLKNVIAANALAIVRSTGDVEFEDCDAAIIAIKTGTGDVEGTLLTAKVFFTKTNTGDVEVPKTMTGGMCEITTDTGDIEVKISR